VNNLTRSEVEKREKLPEIANLGRVARPGTQGGAKGTKALKQKEEPALLFSVWDNIAGKRRGRTHQNCKGSGRGGEGEIHKTEAGGHPLAT